MSEATTSPEDLKVPVDDGTKAPRKKQVGPILAFFSSFKLATLLFFFLLLLTLFGTLAQVEMGIQDVIDKYFTSWLVLEEFPIKIGGDEAFKIVVPLPGGAPVGILLFINILVGGILRIRANWKKVGVVISHFSVLVLLAGGAIAHQYGVLGSMVVYEGEETNVFRDFHLWDIEVVKWNGDSAGQKALILPHEKLRALTGDRNRRFFSENIPFEIEISDVKRNSWVTLAGGGKSRFNMMRIPDAKEVEANVPGANIKIITPEGDLIAEDILWGASEYPLTVETNGEVYGISYERRVYNTTFTVALDDFIKRDYPGTARPKDFRSKVRKLKDGTEEQAVIWMNHPLRDDGYAVFQADYGPKGVPVGQETYSVFQVAKNPTDHLPLAVCVVIGIGLLIHYGIMLTRFLSRNSRSKPKVSSAAA